MTAQETFVTNAAETTLSSSLAAGATTINVTSSSAFPSVPFYAVIDPDVNASREIILVDGSKTATTFTLTAASKRGQDGTTDTSHSSGAKVVCVPVAALWTDINDRVDTAYVAGGTDVAVADGGTGASTAAGARTNLGAVAKAGDTMTGALTLPGPPSSDLHAVTKKYADDLTLVVRKVASESIASTTTLQDDDELLFPIAANEVWQFDFVMFHVAGASGIDGKAAVTAPTGATGTVSTSDAYAIPGATVSMPAANLGLGGAASFYSDNAVRPFTLRGLVVNGANAGNVRLQWAQNTSSVTQLTMREMSYVIARRVT